MHSNNEVGTIQPLRKIAEAVKAFNRLPNVHILLHSDAAQSIGKVCVDVQSAEVDLLTIVGHKFGAPKGVAALYVREGVRWEPTVPPMLVGGGQEHGGRGGLCRFHALAQLYVLS
jgi:cysteine desulfurase